MKGIPTTQETQDRIVKLAKMGYDRYEVADMLGICTRTVSRYGEGLFVHSDRKTSGIKTYAIPKVIWDEWDNVTQSLRKYFCKSKV
ncbi:MAG: hypothetical protein ACI4EH_13040 [Oliverpabstia sp.]